MPPCYNVKAVANYLRPNDKKPLRVPLPILIPEVAQGRVIFVDRLAKTNRLNDRKRLLHTTHLLRFQLIPDSGKPKWPPSIVQRRNCCGELPLYTGIKIHVPSQGLGIYDHNL